MFPRTPEKSTFIIPYSHYESPNNTLLEKSSKLTMEASRLKSLCVEVYENRNSVNPSFLNELFRLFVLSIRVSFLWRLLSLHIVTDGK